MDNSDEVMENLVVDRSDRAIVRTRAVSWLLFVLSLPEENDKNDVFRATIACESTHPTLLNSTTVKSIRRSGANSLKIEFDPQTSLGPHDLLVLYRDEACTQEIKRLKGGDSFRPLTVPSDRVFVKLWTSGIDQHS